VHYIICVFRCIRFNVFKADVCYTAAQTRAFPVAHSFVREDDNIIIIVETGRAGVLRGRDGEAVDPQRSCPHRDGSFLYTIDVRSRSGGAAE